MARLVWLVCAAVQAFPTPTFSQSVETRQEIIPVQRPIAGRVVDATGAPVSSARLWWKSGPNAIEMTPDAEGRFQALSPEHWPLVEGPSGLGTIWTAADGYAIDRFSMYGGDEDAQPEMNITIRLRKTPDRPQPAVRVVTPDGQPVEGALIEPARLTAAEAPPELFREWTGRTNAEGELTLPRLPEMFWQFKVTSPQFGTQIFELFTITGAPAVRTLKLRSCGRLEGRITGTAESRKGLRISLRTPGPRLEGDDEQKQVRNGQRGLADGLATLEFDAEGRFVIPSVAAGDVKFEVESPGEATERPVMPVSVRVAAGQTTSVEIPMVPGVFVSGRVVDEITDRPLPGVQVHLTSGKPYLNVSTKTDALGKYRVAVIPGRVIAHAGSAGSREAGLYMSPLPTDNRIVTADPQGPEAVIADFRLTPARRIYGRLIDSLDRPVRSMRVQVAGFPQAGMSDHNGYFLMSLPITADVRQFKVGMPLGPFGDATIVSEKPLVLRAPDTSNGFTIGRPIN